MVLVLLIVVHFVYQFYTYRYRIPQLAARTRAEIRKAYMEILADRKNDPDRLLDALKQMLRLNWRRVRPVRNQIRLQLWIHGGVYALLLGAAFWQEGIAGVMAMLVVSTVLVYWIFRALRRALASAGESVLPEFIGFCLHLHPKPTGEWLQEMIREKFLDYDPMHTEPDFPYQPALPGGKMPETAYLGLVINTEKGQASLREQDFFLRQYGYLIEAWVRYAPFLHSDFMKELRPADRTAFRKKMRSIRSPLSRLMLEALIRNKSSYHQAADHLHALEPDERMAPLRQGLSLWNTHFRAKSVECLYYYPELLEEMKHEGSVGQRYENAKALFPQYPQNFRHALILLHAPEEETPFLPYEALDFEVLSDLLSTVIRQHPAKEKHFSTKLPLNYLEMLRDLALHQSARTDPRQPEYLRCERCYTRPQEHMIARQIFLLCPACESSSFTDKYAQVVGYVGDLPADAASEVETLYVSVWDETDCRAVSVGADELRLFPSEKYISYDRALNTVMETWFNAGHRRFRVEIADELSVSENSRRMAAEQNRHRIK